MSEMPEKVRENKVRRQLSKLGYYLYKSRIRISTLDNCGGYMIVESYFNCIAAGEHYDLTLDDVERFASE